MPAPIGSNTKFKTDTLQNRQPVSNQPIQTTTPLDHFVAIDRSRLPQWPFEPKKEPIDLSSVHVEHRKFMNSLLAKD